MEPRKGFKTLIKILDKVNPAFVLLSIIGLFIEYTSLKNMIIIPGTPVSVLMINGLIDFIFLMDFICRAIAFPFRQYFFNKYGWVDFLAGIPGIQFIARLVPIGVVANVPGILNLFKILRVGRFFKIIRVLRFLRIFSFLKKMKTDSPFVQNKLMKIGVLVTIVLVIGIGLVDTSMDSNYTEKVQERIENSFNKHRSLAKAVALRGEGVVQAFTINEGFYNKATRAIRQNDYNKIKEREDVFSIPLPHGTEILVRDAAYIAYKNRIMIIMISSLVLIILLVIFYLGFVLAKDVKLMSLIIDSIDADDFMLLAEEGSRLRNEEGEFIIEPEEEEPISLMKMACKLIEEKKIYKGDDFSGMDMPDLSAEADLDVSDTSIDIDDDIDISLDEGMPVDDGMTVDDGISLDDGLSLDDGIDLDDSEMEAIPAGSPETATPAAADAGEIREIIQEETARLKNDLVSEIMDREDRDFDEIAKKAVLHAAKSIIDYINKNK